MRIPVLRKGPGFMRVPILHKGPGFTLGSRFYKMFSAEGPRFSEDGSRFSWVLVLGVLGPGTQSRFYNMPTMVGQFLKSVSGTDACTNGAEIIVPCRASWGPKSLKKLKYSNCYILCPKSAKTS